MIFYFTTRGRRKKGGFFKEIPRASGAGERPRLCFSRRGGREHRICSQRDGNHNVSVSYPVSVFRDVRLLILYSVGVQPSIFLKTWEKWAEETNPTVSPISEISSPEPASSSIPKKIPICGVLGDSHAALFGHGCLEKGMTKATYGTGSSIMMNIGPDFAASKNGLVTSLAWKYKGQVSYVMEGNLNYTGAVITWLKDSLGLIASANETEALAEAAHAADTTCLVPAFTGLGAPYWKSDARAILWGMSRTTGKNEIVRAALDSIAFQIHDVIAAMEKDTGIRLPALRVDGGPTRNRYLMQFQSDILSRPVSCPEAEELSGIGAAMMAGLSCGSYDRSVFHTMGYTAFEPKMKNTERNIKLKTWRTAISRL